MQKKKICFVITSPIHYSRNFLIIRRLAKDPRVDFSVVLGGTVLLPRYMSKINDVETFLKKDGVKSIYKIFFSLEGDEISIKAKTTGLALMEFVNVFGLIKPDVVVVRGDRYEVLAAAVAAAYQNIVLAHIEGGDVSGTLDESVRHAVTKLAHLHFVTNDQSKARILQMGENPKNVFNFGSPDVEALNVLGMISKDNLFSLTGSGQAVDLRNFLMVMFHPVYSEIENVQKQTEILLKSLVQMQMSTVWFWPNNDPGADKITGVLRKFSDKNKNHKIHFSRYLPNNDFIYLLKKTKCLIGNSSAGIKECSFLGTPVVNVGTRQTGRRISENVLEVDFSEKEILTSVKKQVLHGKYPPSLFFYKKNTAENIAETIIKNKPDLQKTFFKNQ